MASFVDFVLTVNGSPQNYTVAVYGPNGTSLEPVPLNLEFNEELNYMLEELYDGGRPSLEQLKILGNMLFDGLFPRRVWRAYSNVLRALLSGQELRIKLNIRPPELARLPWELLYDEEEGAFLVRRRNHPLVRTLDTMVAAAPLSVAGTLRVLHVQASPIDMESLDLDSSQKVLEETFDDRAEVTILKNATPERLRQALHQKDYHILHYDGHATFDEELELGVLFLHDEYNRTNVLTAEMLADYLSGTTVRLVVLSGCETGVDATTHRFAGLAQHLMHSSSIPALIAMQFAVADEAAIAFNRGFYEALTCGEPVEVAMVDGRLAMREVSDSADWLAPLLFMRVEDGSLFALENKALEPGSWVPEIPFLAPPLPPYELVGRDELLREIKERLFTSGNLAISALKGLPGVGKTALAVALAYDSEVLEHFSDGVLWAGLGRHPDILTLLGNWAMALGFTSDEIAKRKTIKERQTLLNLAIGQRHILLVIDDAWQEEAALAFKIGGPNSAHLVTTRQPRIAIGFAGDQYITVEELDHREGLRLLHKLAAKAVEAEAEAARQLVEAVGGLPLALVLMGRFLRKETYDNQPHRLRYALESLHHVEERLLLEQPQQPEFYPYLQHSIPVSLLAAIEVSDQALHEAARQALYVLSVFPPKPNTFSLEAAIAVCDTSVEMLNALTDSGLLESSGPGRYTLHQAIADYATLEVDNAEHYKQRAAAYFAQFASLPCGVGQKNSHASHYRLLDLEWQNIESALEWAYNNHEWQILIDGVTGLTDIHLGVIGFMDSRGHWDEARTLLKRALEGVTDDTSTKASVLSKLGAFAFRQADFERASEYLRESLSLFNTLPRSPKIIVEQTHVYEFMIRLEMQHDLNTAHQWAKRGIKELAALDTSAAKYQTGNFNVLLAGILGRMGQFEQATNAAKKGLSQLPTTPTSARISGLTTLGTLFALQGELQKSTSVLKKGIELARRLGHLNRLATLWMNMGINEKRRANLSLAIASYQKALKLYKQMGDADAEGTLNVNLGVINIILGEDEQALRHLSNAIRLAEAHGLIDSEAFAKANLAQLQIARGRLALATSALNRVHHISIQLNLTYLLPIVLYWQAEIARLKGEHDKALLLIEDSLTRAKSEGYITEEGIGWSIKGKILDGKQQLNEAEMAHQTSLKLLRKQSPYDFAQSQLALAQHYVMRDGHVSKGASSLLNEALATFKKIGAKRGIALSRILLDIGKGPSFIPLRRRAM